jgi:hypothetical protein
MKAWQGREREEERERETERERERDFKGLTQMIMEAEK